jgi:hypothetical protein
MIAMIVEGDGESSGRSIRLSGSGSTGNSSESSDNRRVQLKMELPRF